MCRKVWSYTDRGRQKSDNGVEMAGQDGEVRVSDSAQRVVADDSRLMMAGMYSICNIY
jgi:hypothetical protein